MALPVPGPLLRRTLVRHVLLTVLVAVVLSALTALGVWRYAQDDARRTAEKVARQIASAVLVPLSQRDFGQPGGVARDELLADLAPFLGSGMLERVKVFTVEGGVARIVFSDEQRIEGHTGTLPRDLAERLARGDVVIQPVPDDPEHAYELGLPGERFEVYFGFRDVGGNDALFEVYVPVSVGETTRHAVAILVPLIVAGLLLLAGAMVPLSIALARRMERDRAEQRAARDYGLAAAELARRDLAQRLHDGVIPDLAGASLLLEAISAEGVHGGAEAPWELIGRAQGLVADDLQRLRTLLDDLVPPAVVADRPDAALRELVAQLRRSMDGDEPAVVIDVAEDLGLSEAAAILVLRVAGELLRNAFRHACAGSVRVALGSTEAGSVELTVADDGVGFAPDRPRRPGHVGLQLVRQVVGDSGGRIHVDSRPGMGTVVRAVIPKRLRLWNAGPTAALHPRRGSGVVIRPGGGGGPSRARPSH